MPGRIFISYRRADTRGFSVAIYKTLLEHYHADEIFMDVDSIEPGKDFVQILEDAVDACDVMIALIGPRWITLRDDQGNRRLDNPEDYVRIELVRALEREIRVIPLLVDGAAHLKSEEMPEELKPLARLQAFSIGDYFDSDMKSLLPIIKRAINESQAQQDQQSLPFSQPGSPDVVQRTVSSQKNPLLKKLQTLPQRRLWTGIFVSVIILAGIIWGLNRVLGSGNIPISQNDANTPTVEENVSLFTNTPITYATAPTKTAEPAFTDTTLPEAAQRPALTPVPLITNPIDGAAYVYVPAGEFLMGSEDGDSDEQPVHTVYLDAFYIGQTEVTTAQYQLCVEAKQCHRPPVLDAPYNIDPDTYGNYPVARMNWESAQMYCEWAGGRLPTEAEWEKAARGGLEGKLYPWGEEDPDCTSGAVNGAQFFSCAGTILPVGSFAPNGYGLYDMAGNLWEFVEDWYDEDYYQHSEFYNPKGPETGVYRSIHGGSHLSTITQLTVSNRANNYPAYGDEDYGFRCVVPLFP